MENEVQETGEYRNFIDTADVYSLGESETLVGNALKGVRDEIVLATKVRLPMSENFNRSGCFRCKPLGRRREGSGPFCLLGSVSAN